jgi:hypothetical protein
LNGTKAQRRNGATAQWHNGETARQQAIKTVLGENKIKALYLLYKK